MKILLKFVLIFFLNIHSFAETKIAYVDLDFLLSNSIVGKNLFENLKKKENLKLKELKDQEQKLKNEENKIISSKNLISEEKLTNDIEKFKKKLNDYKILKSSEIDKLQENRNKEVNNLLNSINSIIETYMNEKSITLIIDKKNIYIAHTKHDITNDLMELINNNIK